MAPLYLIDASIYIFRAWFSLPDTLTGNEDQPVNALYGFFDFVTRFVDEVRPQHLVFAFDNNKGQSFRNDLYREYKANRDPTPIELKRQIAYCRVLVRALGINGVASDNYEADDIIGTLAARARAESRPVVVISGDKDLAQVIGTRDCWWDYTNNKKLDYDGVEHRFGVTPEQIADYLAIAGDPVDNIPGVKGVGAVTAARLIRHFGSLDNLLENIHKIAEMKIRGAKRIAELVKTCENEVVLLRRLTKIHCEVPLPDRFSTRCGTPDQSLFESLGQNVGFSAYRHKRYTDCLTHLCPPPA